jgi:acetyl-CoA carboxylase beta subunit
MQEITRKQTAEDKKEPENALFLKKCPECHSELENDLFSGFQYCTVCGYWTRKETARLEPLMILE